MGSRARAQRRFLTASKAGSSAAKRPAERTLEAAGRNCSPRRDMSGPGLPARVDISGGANAFRPEDASRSLRSLDHAPCRERQSGQEATSFSSASVLRMIGGSASEPSRSRVSSAVR